MSSPNYTNLVTQIITRLQEDTRLSVVNDDSILHGDNLPRIVKWPAITVALDRVDESWRSFAGEQGRKTAECTVRLNIYDRVPSGQTGYVRGLQSVESIVQTVDDIIQSDMSISGVSFFSENVSKIFAQGEYNNTPVIGAEIELVTKIDFVRAN